MNIKSISELDPKEVSLSKLSADPNVAIEVDFKQYDGSFKSEKLPIGSYTGQIVNELYKYCSIIDDMMEYFREQMDQLMQTIDISVQYMYEKLQAFSLSSHGEFVHKAEGWKDSIEEIHLEKQFYGTVHISGENSLLCSDTVIEGVTRSTEFST